MVGGKEPNSLEVDQRPAGVGEPRAGADEPAEGVGPEGDEESRLNGIEFGKQVRSADLHLVRLGGPVRGRPTLDDVGDVDLRPRESGGRERPIQDLAGRSDERTPGPVLLPPGGLPDQDNRGIGRSLARDREGPTNVEAASDAGPDG